MKNREKKSKLPIIIPIAILVLIVLVTLIKSYQSIEIEDETYKASKTKSTIQEQTVENAIQESQNISSMIEETTKKVVRNFKIKKYGRNTINRSHRRRPRIRNRSNNK